MSTLDDIRARTAAATKGPWEHDAFDSGHSRYEMDRYVGTPDGDTICDLDGLARSRNEEPATDDGGADAEFIAAARTDIPKLLAALDAITALHQPIDAVMYTGKSQHHKVQVCTGCGQDDGNWNRYPCPTIAAITTALGEDQ